MTILTNQKPLPILSSSGVG